VGRQIVFNKMDHPLLLLLLSLLFVYNPEIAAQEGRKRPAQIEILNADDGQGPYAGMPSDLMRLIGNVRLRHEGVHMQCDSAHRFANANMVHAFGNVHINQGDTLHLYGERLVYNGNTRYAEVRRNVRLTDRETTLTTDFLDFDLANDFGYYPNRGVVINGDNRLESVKGYYYTREKMFFFNDSVVITNPDYVIQSDTLRYNTVTEVAYFLGPTTILGEEVNIYCENGWYDTQTDISQFNENAQIRNNNQVLAADSIFYDNGQGFGRAFLNVEVTDTVERIIIKGDYARFVREREQTMVTDRALLIQMSDNDTLYMHADTLRSWLQLSSRDSLPVLNDAVGPDELTITGTADTLIMVTEGPDSIPANQTGIFVDDPTAGKTTADEITKGQAAAGESPAGQAAAGDTVSGKSPADENSKGQAAAGETPSIDAGQAVAGQSVAGADTIPVAAGDTISPVLNGQETDSVRIMVAYYGARFFSNEMQGKCDSIYYNMRDSIIYMFGQPVIWSDESQLSAEFMEVHSLDGDLDRIIMKNTAFIVSEEQEGLYNQIKGKDIVGIIRDGELYRVNVDGNAETLYYPLENDEIIGINKAASASLVIYLRENKPDRIIFLKDVDSNLFPLENVTEEERILNNFQWLDHLRPVSADDVFRK
jgi:lipopolysaccharide export system protein LptA